MSKAIHIYKTVNGRTPFLTWLSAMKNRAMKAKIMARVDRIRLGHYGDYKSVHRGVLELRIHDSPGYRVYFAEYGSEIVILLLGGTKKTQQKDIQKAKIYWNDFLERCENDEEEY